MAGTIKHEWDGTTLIITSDSGTSAMDLKGEKGDMGIRGPMGAQGCVDTSLVYTTNNPPTAAEVGAVPTNRKINEKELNEDIVLTAADIAAAPAGYSEEHIVVTAAGDMDERLTAVFDSMSEKTEKIVCVSHNIDESTTIGVAGGNWFFTIYKYTSDYGVIEGISYYHNTSNPPRRVIKNKANGSWGSWVNCSPSAFAPAGFGLGVSEPPTTLNDCDNGIYNGWYKVANSATNAPVIAGGWMSACMFSTQYGVQTWHYEMHGGVAAQRYKNNGVWGEWEWVNPPMIPGVEYRTTERWDGKPVYTKLINFGALPNNSEKSATFYMDSNYTIVSIDGVVRGEGLDEYGMVKEFDIHDCPYVEEVAALQLNSKITIKTNCDATKYNAKIAPKYTR